MTWLYWLDSAFLALLFVAVCSLAYLSRLADRE